MGLLILGLLVLVVGAEFFVRGASGLAARIGISPLVVGLTVVAFGTSAPELAVSLSATWKGTPDLAVGNVVGSNIFNVLFILGCAALITPLIVERKLIRTEVPIMIGAALALWLMASDQRVQRSEGIVLFAALVIYISYAVFAARRHARTDTRAVDDVGRADHAPVWIGCVMLATGFAGILVGSNLFVRGATDLARSLGVSDLIVGLTIVAAGTSLPEVATSLVAAIRGHRDIAIGNVVGSNIFNVFCILGLTGALTEGGLPVSQSVLSFDLPVMLAVSIACLPVFISGCGISRGEAIALLVGYVAYTGYLVFDASGHDDLALYSAVTLWFVIPLAGIGILRTALAWWRRRARPPTGRR